MQQGGSKVLGGRELLPCVVRRWALAAAATESPVAGAVEVMTVAAVTAGEGMTQCGESRNDIGEAWKSLTCACRISL